MEYSPRLGRHTDTVPNDGTIRMTASRARPSSRDAVHAALADAHVRRRIEEIVRRRVRPDAVNDVVNQVACDALASALAPTDPAEVPRWLFGITRHKVADQHRSTQRRGTESLDPACAAAPPTPLEARSLLRRVLADATQDARGAETMRWIAREAEGERLDEMAREASLPPATVRQRVSRLRRWLRQRWLHEALVIATAGLVVLLIYLGVPRHVTTPIVADSMGATAAAVSAAVQGRWYVQSVEPDAALDSARRALVDAEALTTAVDVDGDRLRLASATRRAERRIEFGPMEDGHFEVRVADGGGHVQRGIAAFDRSGRLVVTSGEGEWKGRVVLAR
jgi:DNA-directed RNA polymerase specialized sigma24 family protein